MVDTLRDTLTKVNDWVKYAEAKNAANIAFCSAIIFALSRVITSIENINAFVIWYLTFTIVCLLISSVISLLSFVPKLKTPWLHIGKRNNDDNLLYFGHACKYSASSYLDALYSGESHKSDNFDLELAYSDQIVINSKIAYFKFKQFDSALWLTITALTTPIGTLIITRMKQ